MSRGRILIVDDEPMFLASLSELLRGDHTVFTAGRADDGLAILGRERVDVVVSDYQMPGMDGIAFLTEVKRRHPACARILMTAYADLRLVVRALNEGEIHRFISKPYRPFEFRRILGEALDIARLVNRSEGQPRDGRTILVAHDSQITRASLRMLLAPAFTVITTGSGIEVLATLGRTRVDALILGVSLEHLDGCAITTYLKKEKHAATPIVVWGHGIPGAYEEYLQECGADLVVDERGPDAIEKIQTFLRLALPRVPA